MRVIKLDHRYTMSKYGFTHAIEWTNITKLRPNSKPYKDFFRISDICRSQFGESWYRYLGTDGRWSAQRENGRSFARIYFKSERMITMVQLLL
jgi:hypothetical protein